ncbi:MAG: T9SS type A sorting domain-containing protein [Saprospiraceae bacterium]|nr:T9SS type A sorting domain-containing protein [Saprospiraceae bacterium]
MKKTALVLSLFLCHIPLFAQLTVRLTAVPSNTPISDTIFIAGNFNNWNPKDLSKILIRQSDGTYKITFSTTVTNIEYKFTRGAWASVEGNASGGEISNRTLTYNGGIQSIDNQVLSWKDLVRNSNTSAASNVRIVSHNFYMPQFNRTRRVLIYLPPQYADTSKRFPVMYMQDGQNLFDKYTSFSGEWEVDETLNRLAAAGDKGCIVVGIENGGADRMGEYTPWRNARYGGGDGAKYARFLVETLKPYIDANFRTKSDRLNTAIGGSSLGGLISMYAAAEYQSVFSKALVFSPSFWFNDSCFTQARLRGKQFAMRYYFMSGGANEDPDMLPDIQQMVSILRGVGYTDDEFKVVTKTDGQHTEWFWAREFGDGYKWLFREATTKTDVGNIDTKVKLFPNPTDSLLTIETSENLSFTNIEIYDYLGRLMRKEPLASNRTVVVSYLKAGNYILRLTKGNTVLATKPFVKAH